MEIPEKAMEDNPMLSFQQTLIAQIVKEQDEYTVEVIMKYVKEKQEAGELVTPIVIPEGELRHIINLGLSLWAQQKHIGISQENLFEQENYINYLNHRLDLCERRCEELERFKRDTERQANKESLQECPDGQGFEN